MKKVLSLLLICVLCLSFVGCIEEAPTKESGQQTTAATKAPKNETFKLNDVAAFKDLKFNATEIKQTKGKEYFEAGDGKVFVGINFTIENVSDKEQVVSSLLLFDAYCDDVKCDYSFTAIASFDGGTLDGSISPGKKLVGWYTVEIPEGWEKLELEVKSSWLSDSTATFVFENK